MSIKQVMSDKLGLFIGSIMTLLIWSFLYSFINPITITNSPSGIIDVYQDKDFMLCRDIEYSRETSVRMSRACTKDNDSGVIETISFSEIFLTRPKGNYKVCRMVKMPDNIPEGLWQLHTYMEVYTFPFWKHSWEAPVVFIRVHKKSE